MLSTVSSKIVFQCNQKPEVSINYKLHIIEVSVHGYLCFHAGEKRLVFGFLDTLFVSRSSGPGLGGSVNVLEGGV